MKRITRQSTRKAVEIGASPGLVSPMHTTSNRLRGCPPTKELGVSLGNEAYRNMLESLPGSRSTGMQMDGISFDTHQNRYEHDIDSPLDIPGNLTTSARAHQQPKTQKGGPKKRAGIRKAGIGKATTSTSPGGSDQSTSSGSSSDSSTSSGSSGDNSTSSGGTVIISGTVPSVPDPTSAIPTPSEFGPHAATSIGLPDSFTPVAPVTPQPATRKRKPSTDISNSPQRQCNAPLDKGKNRASDEEIETWRTITNIYKDTPEKMEDIQVTGCSQNYQVSPEGMSICSPDSVSGRVEFLRKKYQEFEEMKKQVKNLTEENARWRMIRTETTNRIRPLAALLKVINDEFHVDRENDVDYIYWREVLRS